MEITKQMLLDRVETLTEAEFNAMREMAIGATDQDFQSAEEMEAWFTAAAGGDAVLGCLAAWMLAEAREEATAAFMTVAMSIFGQDAQ